MALEALAKRYASATDVVTSIELLNEPNPNGNSAFLSGMKPFYNAGYKAIREINIDTVVVIHDAFQDFSGYWNGFMAPQTGTRHVMVDTHQYQIFNEAQISLNPAQHVAAACLVGDQLIGTDKWTVVGEWTGAQTE